MRIVFYVFLAFNFILKIGLAQEKPRTDLSKKQNQEICLEINNTFQIQVLNGRLSPLIKNDICQIIVSNRKDTAITYVNYGSNLVIKIYPTNQLATLPKNLPLFTYEK